MKERDRNGAARTRSNEARVSVNEKRWVSEANSAPMVTRVKPDEREGRAQGVSRGFAPLKEKS